MSAHLAVLPVPPTRSVFDEDEDSPWSVAELATARYVDRELGDARASAELCRVVASRARSEGRTLLAGVLGELAAEFTSEAASLMPASRPEVRWPDRPLWQLDHENALGEWIETISAELQHSARTLRWIARRPDLSPLAGVTFDALAFARRAQQRLLLACSAIDD